MKFILHRITVKKYFTLSDTQTGKSEYLKKQEREK